MVKWASVAQNLRAGPLPLGKKIPILFLQTESDTNGWNDKHIQREMGLRPCTFFDLGHCPQEKFPNGNFALSDTKKSFLR